MHYEANVHMLDHLELLIREKYKEYGCGAAVYVVLVANGLEGIGTYQTLQVGEGDPLHVETALWQHKTDVPEAETIITGEHLLGYGLLALDVLQEVLKAKLSHLQKKRRVLAWVQMCRLKTHKE